MKKLIAASVLGIAVLAWSGMADAQKKGKQPPAGDKKGKDKKFDFDADDVTGELIKPEGENYRGRVFSEHSSLIRVRSDFIREIVKSAENL
jgi:hypothetical protein